MNKQLAAMTNKQLKRHTRKMHNQCLKDPGLNKLSLKKLKADYKKANKMLNEVFDAKPTI